MRDFILTTAVAGTIDLTINGFVDSDGDCVYRKQPTGGLKSTVFVGKLTDLTDTYGTLPGYTLTYLDASMGNIVAVTPNTGAAAGGDAVVVSGAGFLNATNVKFASSNATSIVVVSDTKITCVTPAHAAGAVTVTVVITGSPDATLATAFTYS